MNQLRAAVAFASAALSAGCASAPDAAQERGARPASDLIAPAPLTRAQAERMDTAALAQALLGKKAAAGFVGHGLNDSIFPGGPLPSVHLFPRPRPVGLDLCRRDSLAVRLVPVEGDGAGTSRRDAPVKKESVGEKPQIALAPGCALPEGGRFAWVQSAGWEQAAAALRHLAALQRKARGTGRPGATLRCTDAWNGERCVGGPEAALARLPLHRVSIVQVKGEAGKSVWEFAVTPQDPGQPFWDVELEDKAGGMPELRMHWGAPAPF
jgi:hypothetical protein